MSRRGPRLKPPPAPDPPVMVAIHPPLLEVTRAMHPAARDWTDSQLVSACLALSLPRLGTVHTD